MSLHIIKSVKVEPSTACTSSENNFSNSQRGTSSIQSRKTNLTSLCMGEIYSRPDNFTPEDQPVNTDIVHSSPVLTSPPSDNSSPTMAAASSTSQTNTSSSLKIKVKLKTNEEEEEDECVICLDEKMNRTIVTPCMHDFCYECIKRWVNINPECPLCKRSILTLIHKILSDTNYQEEKLPERVCRLFTNGIVPPHDFDSSFRVRGQHPISHGSQIYHRMVFFSDASILHGQSHHETFRQIFSRLFAPGEHFQIRPFVYLLRLESRFQTIRNSFRDYSPEFLNSNATALPRLAQFMARDLTALNIPNSQALIDRILEQLRSIRLESSAMFQFINSTPIARYCRTFQHELEMFAGYTSTIEDYDQAVDFYSSEGNIVYSGSTGVVQDTIVNILLQMIQTLRLTPREMFRHFSLDGRLLYMGSSATFSPDELHRARSQVIMSLTQSMSSRFSSRISDYLNRNSNNDSPRPLNYSLGQSNLGTNRSSRFSEAMTQYSQRLNEVSNDLRRLSNRITIASTRLPNRSSLNDSTSDNNPPTIYNFLNESRLNLDPLLRQPPPASRLSLNYGSFNREASSLSMSNSNPTINRSDSSNSFSHPINLTAYSHMNDPPAFPSVTEPLSINTPLITDTMFAPLPRAPQELSRNFDEDWDFLNRPFASSTTSQPTRVVDLSNHPVNSRIELDLSTGQDQRPPFPRLEMGVSASDSTNFGTTVSPTPPGSPRLVPRPGFSASPLDTNSLLSFRLNLPDRLSSEQSSSASQTPNGSDSPTDCLVTHVTRNDRTIVIESSSSSDYSPPLSPDRNSARTSAAFNRQKQNLSPRSSSTLARKNRVRFSILRDRFTENRIKRMLADNDKSDQCLPLKKRRILMPKTKGKLGYHSDSDSASDNDSDSSSTSSPPIKSVIGAFKGKPLSFSDMKSDEDEHGASARCLDGSKFRKRRVRMKTNSENSDFSNYEETSKKNKLSSGSNVYNEDSSSDNGYYSPSIPLNDDTESNSVSKVSRVKSLVTRGTTGNAKDRSPSTELASTSRAKYSRLMDDNQRHLELVSAADPIVISSDDDDSDDLVMGEVIPPSIILSNNEDEPEGTEHHLPSPSLQHPQPELMDIYEPDNEDDFYRVLQESLECNTTGNVANSDFPII